MAPVRRLVLDLLKPGEIPTVTFAQDVSDLAGVDATAARLVETDREVQNIALVVEGNDVDVDAVVACVEDLGATLHSVDEVVCGEYIPERYEAHLDATWLR